MRRRLACVLLVSACVRPLSRPIAPPGARAVEPPMVPARARRLPHDDTAEWWIGDRDGRRLVIVRGRRLEVEGASVRAADGWFGAPLLAAWEVEGRWEFAARTARWSAESFLGPLQPVASTPTGTLGLGSGRAAVIRDGATEGLGLPPGYVLDAAFGDALRGIAILEPGRVLHTEDGGTRWSPGALDDDTPLEVVAVGARRWIRGESRCHEVDEAGLARSCPCDDLPLLRRPLPPETNQAVQGASASDQDWTALAFTDASQRRLLVRVRAHTYGDEGSARAAIYDLDRDELVAGTETNLPCDPERGDGVFLADVPYLHCRAEPQVTVLWSLGPDARWRERLRTWGCDAGRRCAASATGDRVTCMGRCDEGATCAGGTTFCERVGERPLRQWTEGSMVRAWSLAGYDGEAPVLLDQRDWLAHAEVRRGSEAPTPLVTDPAWADFRLANPFWNGPALGRDGVLRFWATRGDGGASVALEGRPGGPVSRRASPPWVAPGDQRATFAYCGADGIALATARDGTPWRSRGRDDPWRPLLPGEIDPALAPLREPTDSAGEPPRCSALGWSGGAGHSVLGWGPPAPSRHGATGGASTPREEDAPTPWRCVPRGSQQPRSGLPSGTTWVGPLPQGDRVQQVGPLLRLWTYAHATPSSPAPRVLRYRAGAPEEGPTHQRHWHVLSADAAGATVLVWAEGGASEPVRARLTTLSASAPPRVSDPLPGWTLTPFYASATTIVARENDVTAALSLRAFLNREEVGPTRSAGFLTVTGRAAPVVRRVSIEGRLRPPGVFVLDGRAGLARVRADGTVLGSAPGEPSRPLARSLATTPCGPAARGAFTFVASAPTPDSTVSAEAREEYALDGDVLCLRMLRSSNVVATSTADGVVGVRDETTEVRCVQP